MGQSIGFKMGPFEISIGQQILVEVKRIREQLREETKGRSTSLPRPIRSSGRDHRIKTNYSPYTSYSVAQGTSVKVGS